MTDDERQLLIYVAVKQANIDSTLSALVPVLIDAATKTDEEKRLIPRGEHKRAYDALFGQILQKEIAFLHEQHPAMKKLISDVGMISTKDVIDGLKDFKKEG